MGDQAKKYLEDLRVVVQSCLVDTQKASEIAGYDGQISKNFVEALVNIQEFRLSSKKVQARLGPVRPRPRPRTGYLL